MMYKISKTLINKIVQNQKQIDSYIWNIAQNQDAIITIDNTSEEALIRKLSKLIEFDELCSKINVDPVSLKPLMAWQKIEIKKNHWTLDEFNNERIRKRISHFDKMLDKVYETRYDLKDKLWDTVTKQIK